MTKQDRQQRELNPRISQPPGPPAIRRPEPSGDGGEVGREPAGSPGRAGNHADMASDPVLRDFLRTDGYDRRRISRHLYDTVGQSLVALKLSIYRVERSLIREIENASAETKAITDRLIEQLRDISDSLLPVTLDDFGLRKTLEDLFLRYEESSSVRVEFTAEGLEERMPLETEAGIYRIVRETLLNMVSNLQSGEVKIILAIRGGAARLNILISGHDLASCTNENAEATICDMARYLGGSATVKVLPGKLRLISELPVSGESGES